MFEGALFRYQRGLCCDLLDLPKGLRGGIGPFGARIRADEHLAAICRKQPSSALAQHIQMDHDGEEEEPEFKLQVRQRFEDALTYSGGSWHENTNSYGNFFFQKEVW